MNEEKIKSTNRLYKEWANEQKKLGLIEAKVSFKEWLNNIFIKDERVKNINPDKPTDFSDKKMKLHIFGVNAFVWIGGIAVISAVLLTAYYIKKYKKLAA